MTRNKVHTEKGDSIAGDHIRVTCRKKGAWTEIRKSGQHNGHQCEAKKDAKAEIVKAYTNVSA